jgi:hypothetical protein
MDVQTATGGTRSKKGLHDLATSVPILHESRRSAVGVEVDAQVADEAVAGAEAVKGEQ